MMSGAMSNIHSLIGKYAHFFQNDGSTIQGHIATWKMKPEQNAVYQKARPVSYALRELLDKEIYRLESSGVLYRVDNSDNSPTVNVPKLKKRQDVCAYMW